MSKKLKGLVSLFFIFCMVMMSLSDLTTAMAASELRVTSNKELTSKFNKYDTVTVTSGKTLTLAKRSGEPVGLEIGKKLVLEEGARLTGDGILIFDINATWSGITLYYKFEGKVYPIPAGMNFTCLSNDANDYRPNFVYDSKNDRYVLSDEFKGGDPFELDFQNREMTVMKGKTLQLDLSGVTEGVKWSSSDKKIASVSSTGLLTAKKCGNVVITATYNGKERTCNIEVVQKGLSSNTVYLNPGQKMKISLYGTKVKSVSSTKKSVAKINKKLEITGVKDGTCKVKVVGTNGKKYTCTVVVGDPGDNNGNPGNNNGDNNGNNNGNPGNNNGDNGGNNDNNNNNGDSGDSENDPGNNNGDNNGNPGNSITVVSD